MARTLDGAVVYRLGSLTVLSPVVRAGARWVDAAGEVRLDRAVVNRLGSLTVPSSVASPAADTHRALFPADGSTSA